jgi:hypothetical protein
VKLQLLITTLALAAVSLALGQEARIGGDAPLFTLNDADGKSHNLADYKGSSSCWSGSMKDVPS